MKKFVTVSLSVVVALSLFAGCSSTKTNSSSASTDASKTTTATQAPAAATVKIITSSGWTPAMEKIASDYIPKAVPGVTLKVEGYPFDQMFQIIEVKLGAGDQSFDIIGTDVPMVASYGLRDFLLPLDKYFTDEEKGKMIKSAIDAGTYKGKLLAPPLMNSSSVLYYNKNLLQKAGLEMPSDKIDQRWTYEKLTKVAVDAQKKLDPDGKLGIMGLSFDQISRPYQILPLPNSLGGKGIADDGYTVDGVLNSDAWVKSMQWYSDIHNKLNIAPKGQKSGATGELFNSGKLVFFIGGTTWTTKFNKDTYGFAPHPYFEGGKPVTPTGSWHLGVNKNSKNADASAKVIKYLSVTKEGATAWLDLYGNLSSNKEVLDNISKGAIPMYNEFPLSVFKVVAAEAQTTAVPRPFSPGYREWEQVVGATMEDIRNGAEPKGALDAAVSQLKNSLAKYK